jgi:hypothetical protein
MAGFSSVRGQDQVVYCDNVSFDGSQRNGRVTTDGELLIGSTASPNIRVATLTAGSGISIVNASGSITISASSSPAPFAVTSLDDTDSDYTVLSTDYYLSCDTTNGVLTIDLPDAPTTGTVYIIKDSTGQAAANNITVTTVGGLVNIDGSLNFIMNTAYESINVLFNGTSWEIW